MTDSTPYKCQILKLTNNNVLMLKEMKKKGFVTRSNKIYKAALGFYINVWFLRDEGLVKENGSDSRNRKRWCLTDKGRKIIDLVERIDSIWEERKE